MCNGQGEQAGNGQRMDFFHWADLSICPVRNRGTVLVERPEGKENLLNREFLNRFNDLTIQ